MSFLLDTDICIYLINKKPISIVEKLKEYENDNFYISSITLAELEYGISKSKFPNKNRMALIKFLIPFEIQVFDHNCAFYYGKIREYLEKNGKIIGSMDLLIAAIAKTYNLTLISNNIKEFKRIPGLKLKGFI